MLCHILKKDLKRKKTMNVILLLFIVLAAMFLSSSVGNLLTISGAVDSFMEQAKAPDYLIITAAPEGERQIGRLSGEIEDFLGQIVRSSGEDILSIQVENTEFYLKELVEKLRRYYEPKCRLRMTELTVGAYENRLVKGDREKTFEVIENVVENALKYGDGKRISITFYEEDYCQIIQIRNSGQPVKAEEMPHLFDSFFRGSNVEGCPGNGLGLYICRVIMQKMEGDIFGRREEDGMSFHIVLNL